jgi:hypothetical protein
MGTGIALEKMAEELKDIKIFSKEKRSDGRMHPMVCGGSRQWLYRAEFAPWSGYFAILPDAVYNDRPVGGAFIKLLYRFFALNHGAMQRVLLCLHALNCVALYAFARRYVGRGRALFAAGLAAMWFAALDAVGWTAAIFDLLGASLCLLTLLWRQIAADKGNDLRLDLAGAVTYFLAIRTKEFALGAIVLLLAMGLLLERRRIGETAKALWPYFVVVAMLAARYGYLLLSAPPAPGVPYRLQASVATVVTNLRFHGLTVLNRQFLGTAGALLLLACIAAGLLAARAPARRVAAFGLLGFLVLLGPTLLLPHGPGSDYQALYLYAPHFFLALALGAILGAGALSSALALVVAVTLLFSPGWADKRASIEAYYFATGEANRSMLRSALAALGPVQPDATIVIAGVQPYFNPFSAGSGSSLKVVLRDNSLRVVMDQPDSELTDAFCQTRGPRRFLRFDGTQATDVSAETARACPKKAEPQGHRDPGSARTDTLLAEPLVSPPSDQRG